VVAAASPFSLQIAFSILDPLDGLANGRIVTQTTDRDIPGRANMHRKIAITFGVALSVFLFVSAATPTRIPSTQSKAEQEVIMTLDEIITALVKRDGALIERVFTDDYFTVFEGGGVGDRARLIESLKSTTSGWDDWQRVETRVNLHGDTAIVLCRYKVKGHNPRGSFEADWRSIGVMLKERGQWRLAASQFTAVKPPPPPKQP
jgi:ketosteroid isomerase-like protein